MDRPNLAGVDLSSLDGVLSHYGVKGMRWGVRRSLSQPSSGASDDATRASQLQRKARTGGTKALTNRDLQDLVTRLNLEQQYDRLRPRRPSEKVAKFVAETLLSVGKEQASKYARDIVATQVGNVVKKK